MDSAERAIFPEKHAAHGAGCANLGRCPGVHQFSGGALRHVDEHAQWIGLRQAIQRRGCRAAAGRHQIADVDLALGDGAIERRLDLLELRQRAVLIDLGFVQIHLRIGRIEARLRALVVSLLRLPLLVGHNSLRRIAPALIGRFAELGLRLARLDLRLVTP
jgi:hypothetical protein